METILDSAQSESGTLTYAGFWMRFGAMLIDGVIIFIVEVPITMMFFGGMIVTLDAISSSAAFTVGLYYIIILGLNWIYYAAMESSSRQATLGKSAVGIKVTNLNGERISFLNATGRYFSKFISTLILMIGYLMAAFTEKKQALHDQIAGTLVVRQ